MNLPLDQQYLQAELGCDFKVTVEQSVASTNNFSAKASHLTEVQLAEQQTMGRGRFGREWHSPAGQNIYLSIRKSMPNGVGQLAGLSLALAMSLCDAIEEQVSLPERLGIKWPNDIFYYGKKFAGVLVELKSKSLVVGLGLNVNMSCSKILVPNGISIFDIVGTELDRNRLVVALIKAIEFCFAKYKTHGFSAFSGDWAQRDILLNNKINLQHGPAKIAGVARGIDPNGHLLVETMPGQQQTFIAGEVSLGSACLKP